MESIDISNTQHQPEQDSVIAPTGERPSWTKLVLFGFSVLIISVGLIYTGFRYGRQQERREKETSPTPQPTTAPTESPDQTPTEPPPESADKERPKRALTATPPPITSQPPYFLTPTFTPEVSQPVKDRVVEIMIDNGTLFSPEDNGYSYPYYHLIMKRFYQKHPDIYDFTTIYDDKTVGEAMFHSKVKSSGTNIGTGVEFDQSDYYGSGGRLLGFNTLHSIDEADPSWDGPYNAIIHETAHQWLIYLRDTKLEKLNNTVSFPHWSVYFDLGGVDPMGGGYTWVNNQDGTCTARRADAPEVFSWLSLYLMGLAKPDEAPKYLLAEPSEFESSENFQGFKFETAPNNTVQCTHPSLMPPASSRSSV